MPLSTSSVMSQRDDFLWLAAHTCDAPQAELITPSGEIMARLVGKTDTTRLLLTEIAAAPLFSSEGDTIATLKVYDREPRLLTVGQAEGLRRLAAMAARHWEAESRLQTFEQAEKPASRFQSEFIATMSHEIRTPLSGILGTTELLLSSVLPERQRQLVETTRSSAEALLCVVNDILDYSKMEAGKIRLEIAPFDLRVLIEEVIRIVLPAAQEKNLELLAHYAPSAPRHFLGDSNRIRQILLNLVGNAVKFTRQGYVVVHIECDELSEENGDVSALLWIAVEDTGIGIPPEKIELIFEKFSQADTSTTREFGGTGLGLSISRHLAEIMGGTLGATSTVGEGSTFCLTLHLPIDERNPPVYFPSLSGDAEVLILDENPLQRAMMVDTLRESGVIAQACLSADAALTFLQNATARCTLPRVLLFDRATEQKTIPPFSAQIRAEPKYRDVSLVFLTGPGEVLPETTRFDAVLSRPLLPRQLRDVIAPFLDTDTPFPLPVEASQQTPPDAIPQNLNLRVLLAEDNPVNQKVMGLMLERLGCACTIVGDGAACVEALQKETFDVVLLDCYMAGMDGYTAAAHIRTLEQGSSKRVPLIAVTANISPGDRERCLAVGMDDYLNKPVRVAELARILTRFSSALITQKAALFAQVGNNKAVLIEIRELLETSSLVRLSAFRQALRDANTPLLQRLIHSIKGEMMALGQEQLTGLVRDMETEIVRTSPPPPLLESQAGVLERNLHHLIHLLREAEEHSMLS